VSSEAIVTPKFDENGHLLSVQMESEQPERLRREARPYLYAAEGAYLEVDHAGQEVAVRPHPGRGEGLGRYKREGLITPAHLD
jgi:hypothetical protein